MESKGNYEEINWLKDHLNLWNQNQPTPEMSESEKKVRFAHNLEVLCKVIEGFSPTLATAFVQCARIDPNSEYGFATEPKVIEGVKSKGFDTLEDFCGNASVSEVTKIVEDITKIFGNINKRSLSNSLKLPPEQLQPVYALNESSLEIISMRVKIAELINDKNFHKFSEIGYLIANKIDDPKQLKSILLFAEGYGLRTESCGTIFIENEILDNDGNSISAGWHDQVEISRRTAKKGKENECGETATFVISEIKRKTGCKALISIPAFSNAHDRLTFVEKPFKMYDPIFNEEREFPNAEFAFQYQKYSILYQMAIGAKDTKRMEEIVQSARKVISQIGTLFTTEGTVECQIAGSPTFLTIDGYLGEGRIKKNSEADYWDNWKYTSMTSVVVAKLKSRPDLVAKLLLTSSFYPLTFIKQDATWGTGLYGQGEDNLARIYEEVRKTLLSKSTEEIERWFEAMTEPPIFV